MNLLIFALVAIFVGLAKSIKVPQFTKAEVLPTLHNLLGLTPETLTKECNVDLDNASDKLVASCHQVSQIVEDIKDEIKKQTNVEETDPKFKNPYKAKCEKNEALKKELTALIQGVVPCAKGDRQIKLVEEAKKYACSHYGGPKPVKPAMPTKSETKGYLKDFFGLTPAIMKQECNNDFQTAWPKISASLQKLFQVFEDIAVATMKETHMQTPDPTYDKKYKDNCHNSQAFKNANIGIIHDALPCATKDRQAALMAMTKGFC